MPDTDRRRFGRPSRGMIVVICGAVFLAVAALSVIGTGENTADRQHPLSIAATGDMERLIVADKPRPAPSFDFNDDGGQTVNWAQFSGKIVLVNLWASWCVPCREEIAQLNALQHHFDNHDFTVLAISLDREQAPARSFLDSVGADALGFFHDPSGRIGAAFGARGLPASYLLDRQGAIIGTLIGPADWSSADAIALIQTLLNPPA